MALPDSFTGANGTELSAYNSAWVSRAGYTGVMEISSNSAKRRSTPSATCVYYYNVSPASADYDVVADFYYGTNSYAGICGRLSTSSDSMYLFRQNSVNGFHVVKVVNGTFTTLGTSSTFTVDSSTHSIKLEMIGASLKGYIDGVERVSVTDSGITATGFGGLRFNATAGNNTLDNFDIVSGGGADALTSQSISTDAPTITQIALGQVHALTSQSVSTGAATVSTPAIAQVHALSVQAIATAAPTITTPALTASSGVDNLIALALSTGAITITQATLAQHHVLTAQAIATSTPTITTPALTAAASFDNLTAQDIATSAPTITTPGIGQIHVFAAVAIDTLAATISFPTLGAPGTAVYPTEAQVQLGITYGPTGADYVGTLTGGSGPSAVDIAAAVWSYTQ